MPEAAQISDDALREAIDALEKLAKDEYGASLKDLFVEDEPVPGNEYETSDVRESHDAFWRVGRLTGIAVKEPFATTPRERTKDDVSQTGARRVWGLKDETLASEHPDWWQYRLIKGFLADTEDRRGYFEWLPPNELSEVEQVAWFLREAHSERGVFGALAKGARKYLCRNPKVEAAFASSGAARAQAGSDVGVASERQQQEERPAAKGRITVDSVQTAAQLVTSGAATVLVSEIPWVDGRMTPFVAGLLLAISSQGLDRFCSRAVPSPVTDVVET